MIDHYSELSERIKTKFGLVIPRSDIKSMAFGLIYGANPSGQSKDVYVGTTVLDFIADYIRNVMLPDRLQEADLVHAKTVNCRCQVPPDISTYALDNLAELEARMLSVFTGNCDEERNASPSNLRDVMTQPPKWEGTATGRFKNRRKRYSYQAAKKQEQKASLKPLVSKEDVEELRASMAPATSKVTYECLDKPYSPFKCGCNCREEFTTFDGLREHLRKNGKGVPSRIAAGYLQKGKPAMEVE